ncbi:hypothetical protein D3093_26920 (plasmid) [Azospirillum argentinense]|uniref:Uncharacterized protein n=1 Tax=Azospirillum argentinense TaxID=2970906 RepID=A0A4D8PP37_9PROT|nr:hypothetical protein [Azospirillum argentinense]QCN98920.1 hypothetical protein D3093_26920 [Azospirillum argentinense]
MAHEAMLAGDNVALRATLDPTGWDPAADAAMLQVPDGVRACSIGPGLEGAPVRVRGVLDGPELISFAALYDTVADQSDTHELRLYSGADYTGLAWTSGRVPVLAPLFDPADLAFEADNKFSGGVMPKQYLALPRNIYLFPPAIYAQSFEWFIWSAGVRADGTIIGRMEGDFLWLGDGVFFDLQLDSEIAFDTGASSKTEGARTLWYPGRRKRTATLPLAMVEPGLVDQLVTMINEAGGTSPLAWVPDRDDAAAALPYGFLARGTKVARRWSSGSWADSALNLEEFR